MKTTLSPQNSLTEANFRLFLQSELLRRCEKNSSYSLRAFARALGCDISTLSKILSGKRNLGRLAIQRMGDQLGLSPIQIQKFVHESSVLSTDADSTASVANKKKSPGAGAEAGADYQQLTIDSFKIISDWYHFAILELMRLPHFQPEAKWIAKTLGLKVAEVNAAVERLQRIGLLEVADDGEWIDQSGGKTTTIGNAFTHSALKNLQKKILEMAIDALEQTPFEKRDQSGVTMAMNSKLLPEAKEKIKTFRRELAGFVRSRGPLDSVYQLSVSLYPLIQNKIRASARKENK